MCCDFRPMFPNAIPRCDYDVINLCHKCDQYHVNSGELQMLTAALRSSCLASQIFRSPCLASQSFRSSCQASQRLTVCFNHLPLPLGYSVKHPSHCWTYLQFQAPHFCSLSKITGRWFCISFPNNHQRGGDAIKSFFNPFIFSSSRSFNMLSLQETSILCTWVMVGEKHCI